MKKLFCAVSVLAALAQTGCVNGPRELPLPESHPANPAAGQAAHTPPAPFLMAETNLVMIKPVSTRAAEHEHHHDAKPEPATTPQHEHH
jgi:hypothetical protein